MTFSPDTFDDTIITGKAPALVNFFAGWCGPCRLQAPIMGRLIEEYQDRMVIGRVCVDEHEALAARFDVKTLPTTLVFFDGALAESLIGFQSEEYLRAYLDQLLSQKTGAPA